MPEKLEIYDLKSNFKKIENRKSFYKRIEKEFEETGKITEKVKTIRLLLLNSSGRIYLQKRSKIKKHNAGKYDKTVGGHVTAGESYKLTVVRECAEELGFPATVLKEEDFKKAIASTDLKVIGIFKKLDYDDSFLSIRTIEDGSTIKQPDMCSIYFGYYDGAIKFADGESSGIEVFSLNELKEELKENPNKFTEDIKYMLKKYEKHLTKI